MTYDTAEKKAVVSSGGAISALVPTNIEETWRLAEGLSRAGEMIPQAFRGDPAKTMAAILKGMEVGLAPMQALASIAVINGRATVWGDAIPALVMAAGHHVDCEVTGEGDNIVATATLTRADGQKVVRTFSMQDARLAGLQGKQGPWKQYPKRMLAMRARSWAARDGAADALMGLHIREEVQDYHGPDHAKDVTPERTGRARMSLVPPETDATPHSGHEIVHAPADDPAEPILETGSEDQLWPPTQDAPEIDPVTDAATASTS
ncbi:MAG: hypothetical protein AAF501_17955 [Pseudomonadota bacterium]